MQMHFILIILQVSIQAFGVDYTPVRGYTFSDDLTSKNVQLSFDETVPTTLGSTSETGRLADQICRSYMGLCMGEKIKYSNRPPGEYSKA
jgi:hypothetical protein